MKIFSLNKIVDLKETQKPNEFAALEKFQTQNSMVQRWEAKYPLQPSMPTSPENLKEHPRFAKTGKSLQELSFQDWEMLRFAYEKAMEVDKEKRVLARIAQKHKNKIGDRNKAIAEEVMKQEWRIFMTWVSRFRLEEMFFNLKINSLDEFKAAMHRYHVKADNRHFVQNKLYLRQFNMDPEIFPDSFTFKQMKGVDDLILRIQADDDRMKLINLADVRLKMAQLQASSHMAQQEAVYRGFCEKADQEHSGPTESQKRIKGIK